MPVKVAIFADYSCPDCYIANAWVEKLSGEADIDPNWKGLEMHPELPEGGMLLADYSRDQNPVADFQPLIEQAAAEGLSLGVPRRLPNTRLALEMAEFARDMGEFPSIHNRLFKAHFEQGEDIASLDTLLAIWRQEGNDPAELREVLLDHRYEPRLRETANLARRHGIQKVPTFLLAGREVLVRPQSYESLKRAVTGLQVEA